MCGIFGFTIGQNSEFGFEELVKLTETLAVLSESRGKESSGIAVLNGSSNEITVLKAALPASKLTKNIQFEKYLRNSIRESSNNRNFKVDFPLTLIGHSRLVTKGSEESGGNNQPVIKNGIVGIHNGIIVNDEILWKENPVLNREYEVDTEVLFALIKHNLGNGLSLENAVSNAFNSIVGTASIVAFFDDRNELLLSTNYGSLYYIHSPEKRIVVFASEKYILKKMLDKTRLGSCFKNIEPRLVLPNTGLIININTTESNTFSLTKSNNLQTGKNTIQDKRKINITNLDTTSGRNGQHVHSLVNLSDLKMLGEEKLLEYNIDRISKLKRCKICLLPETFPNIEFDKDGVCMLCKNHHKQKRIGSPDELYEIVKPYRNLNMEPDCIVPYSGGRDSSYSLHIIKNELKLNPIAFTYDWGMVTDLARRNIARVCGKLGIENIIVSADIRRKREYIKQNVSAWLKRPDLGMIPLFMAGDKQFFYYTNRLKKQTGIDLNIWGINKFENTDFKVGFSGVKYDYNKERIYSLNTRQKMRLFRNIGKNIVCNPTYLNKSVFDSIWSFYSRYLINLKDYYQFYDYFPWEEKTIIETLRNDYDWELADDTKSTWRIGDGTAPFYNYIYYTVCGFSEIDTFRSNQIREGQLDRETALQLVNVENQPRYQSVKWYLEIIGLDFKESITAINRIKKLYN